MGPRSWAYLIDFGVTLVISVLSVTLAAAVGYETQSQTPGVVPRGVLLGGVLSAIAQIIYFVPSWVLLRGTPGQRMLGLQLGYAPSGKRLGWVDAFIRWGVLQGPFALQAAVPGPWNMFAWLFAAVWMPVLLFSTSQDPDGRGLHDRVAGSLVVSGA